MSNYENMVSRQRKWFLYVIAIIALVTVVIPNKYFFLSLLVGTIVGFYNLWLIQRRTHMLGEAAAKSGKRIGIGTISRLAMAALGTMLVIHYDLSIFDFVLG